MVTGLGAVTALGASLAATRAARARGERAAGRPVPGAPRFAAAAVAPFDERSAFRYPKALKIADRKCRFAVAAAVAAVADAGLAGDADREGWGVILGCSASNLQVEEIARALAAAAPEELPAPEDDGVSRFAGRVLSGLHPLWLLVNLPNMIGAHVGIQLEANGPNQTVTGDAIAGAQAIGEAWLAIAGGECDVAIAGGADAPLDPFDLGLFASGAAPRRLAEGAAMLLLEERGRALARGARIYAAIEGYASAPTAEAALRRAGEAAATRAVDLAAAELGDTVAASGALAAALALAGASERRDAAFTITARGTLGQAATLRFRSEAAALVPALATA